MKSTEVRNNYLAQFTHFREQLFDDSNNESIAFNELRTMLEKSMSDLPEKCQEVFRMSRSTFEHSRNCPAIEYFAQNCRKPFDKSPQTSSRRFRRFLDFDNRIWNNGIEVDGLSSKLRNNH
jgi:hypothetical protein